MEPLTTAHFSRKAVSVAELPDSAAFTAQERFAVAKVIELTAEQYRYFSTHLLEDMPFIAENTELAGFDEQHRRKVLMVTTPERHSCLLVDTQGVRLRQVYRLCFRKRTYPGRRRSCGMSEFERTEYGRERGATERQALGPEQVTQSDHARNDCRGAGAR